MKNIIKKISKPILGILIGIFLTLVILEIFLRVFGWWHVNKFNFQEAKTKNKNEIVILALGDSMTALGGRDSYPAQLERILNKSGKIAKKVRVVNGGVVMSSSSELTVNYEAYINKYTPNIVLVMSGFNDYYENYFKQNLLFTKKSIKNKPYEITANINKKSFFYKFNTYRLLQYFTRDIEEIGKKNYQEVIKLGDFYSQNGDNNLAFKYYLGAIVKNNKLDIGYLKLFLYSYFLPLKIRLGFCELAYKINPNNYSNNYCLRAKYMSQGYGEGILYLKKLADKFPNKTEPLLEIARLEYSQSKFDASQKYLEKALLLNDNYPKKQIIELLIKIYGKQEKTEEIKLLTARLIQLNKETQENLNRMAELASKNVIEFIGIQYPRRDVNILKSYLKDSPHTYFVDNNESFEKAVEQYGFDKVFVDAFAGDFGHGSALGNKIIAENVAKVILEQVFKNEKLN